MDDLPPAAKAPTELIAATDIPMTDIPRDYTRDPNLDQPLDQSTAQNARPLDASRSLTAGLRVLVLCDGAEAELNVTPGGPISVQLAHSWFDVFNVLEHDHIDVLVLESFTEDTLEADHITRALREAPDLHIALVAADMEPVLARLALRQGANGIILHPAPDEVLDTPLRMVAEGKVYIDSALAGVLMEQAAGAGEAEQPLISLTDTVAVVADDDEYFRMALTTILEDKFGFTEVFEASNLDQAEQIIAACGRVDLALFDLRMPGMEGAASLGKLRQTHPGVRKLAVVSASQDRNDVLQSLAVGTYGYVSKAEGIGELKLALSQILQGRIYAPALLHEPPELDAGATTDAGVVLSFSNGQEVQFGEDAEDLAAAARYVPEPAPAPAPNATQAQGDVAELETLPDLSPRQRHVLELLVKGMSNKEIAREMNLGIGTVKVHVTALFTKLGVSNRTSAVAVGAPLL
jgi:DNA-binding NarL/FixJ family response regulator